jgi:hypothetical protein
MKDEKASLYPPIIERSRWSSVRLGAALLSLLLPAIRGHADDDSWAMLPHDAGRSGATSTEIRPPFERKWYRLFADEGLIAGMLPSDALL